MPPLGQVGPLSPHWWAMGCSTPRHRGPVPTATAGSGSVTDSPRTPGAGSRSGLTSRARQGTVASLGTSTCFCGPAAPSWAREAGPVSVWAVLGHRPWSQCGVRPWGQSWVRSLVTGSPDLCSRREGLTSSIPKTEHHVSPPKGAVRAHRAPWKQVWSLPRSLVTKPLPPCWAVADLSNGASDPAQTWLCGPVGPSPAPAGPGEGGAEVSYAPSGPGIASQHHWTPGGGAGPPATCPALSDLWGRALRGKAY